MYIHAKFMVSVAFNIYWHDVQHIVGPPNTEWIKPYLDLIQYNGLVRTPYVTYSFVLHRMLINCKKYLSSCATDDVQRSYFLQGGIMSAPCGRLSVSNDVNTPLSYSWKIRVRDSFKINVTVHKIAIPHEKFITCVKNYLLIYESTHQNIAKLCGRATKKIFYSNSSLINLDFVVMYLKNDDDHDDTVLYVVYQVLSKATLLAARFSARSRHPRLNDVDVQQFIAVASDLQVKVLYYNTYVWKRFQIMIYQKNCSSVVSKVFVYDGPSRKSKLLRETTSQEVATPVAIKSSLSIIAVHFLDAVYDTSSVCFNTSVLSIDIDMKNNLLPVKLGLGKRKLLGMRLSATEENVLRVISIQALPDNFINIKMSKFLYTGNTEAGCYLGGIFIYLYDRPGIGPLCGEVGRTIFEDGRLDGLTLGSRRAFLIIFLFSGENSRISGDFILSVDECEGIPNPCDVLLLKRRLIGQHIDLEYMGPKNLMMRVKARESMCFKMQFFFDTAARKDCQIIISHSTSAKLYRGDIKMVTAIPQDPVLCPSSPYYIITNSKVDLDYQTQFKDIASFTSVPSQNATLATESLTFEVLAMIVSHRVDCAPKYDGVADIRVQYDNNSAHETCSGKKIHPYHAITEGHLPFFRLIELGICSFVTNVLSYGVYLKSFLFF